MPSSILFRLEFLFILESSCQSLYGEHGCQISDLGDTVFNGAVVIIWQKNFPYGPLLDY